MKADDHFRSVVLLLGLYQLSMKLYKNQNNEWVIFSAWE
jgi:hypothetical protein